MEEVSKSVWAFAGISIVNAIPSWLGSTMAINVKVEVEESCCSEEVPSSLIKTIISYFKEKVGILDLNVRVKSPIPPRSGLKTSSAVAVALIEAIRVKYHLMDLDVPKLAADLSIKAGVSVTGAYDDAVASYHGGISLTDNRERKIIDLRRPPRDLVVVVLVRGDRPDMDLSVLRKYRTLFEEIFNMALKGDLIAAAKLNGIAVAEVLGYDTEPIRKALKLGALAAGVSGNGPSIFALTKEGEEGSIVDYFSKMGTTLVTKPADIARY